MIIDKSRKPNYYIHEYKEIWKVPDYWNVSGQEMESMKNEILDTLENLSAIAEENSAATEEVTASLEEQTASIEEMASASEGLSNLAQNLQSIIMKFKIWKLLLGYRLKNIIIFIQVFQTYNIFHIYIRKVIRWKSVVSNLIFSDILV